MNNIKKLALGLTVAAFALGFSAFTAIEKKSLQFVGEPVGQESPNKWHMIDPLEEGETWDCNALGTICTGTLKEGAVPNPDGTYNDSDVDYIVGSRQFRFLDPAQK